MKDYTITISKNTIRGILAIMEYVAILWLYLLSLHDLKHVIISLILFMFVLISRLGNIIDRVIVMFDKREEK